MAIDISETRDRNLVAEMEESYMDYAMSVLVDRALPDVRDGLKPVHRRVLYAMHELGNRHNSAHKKSARIVGDVLGKYHPHGDAAAYDAIVRMAQSFSLRYPLVDGQGNFGSVDGDNAAAMRYTEIRMARMASELMQDIDANVVDTKANYDGSEHEPCVLPAAFPNLLVNGSEGIAVGMATKIPPHYLGDVVKAVIAQVDNPDITNEELADILVAPDFPTGGIICGTAGARQAYTTGKGGVVVRARLFIEEDGNHTNIIFTELPYQVNKARLMERMAEQIRDGNLPDVAEIRDESDKSGMRGVIRLKRGTNVDVAVNRLYTLTDLQTKYSMNLVALDHNVPKRMTLREMIGAYISHRRTVIWRRTEYQIAALTDKMHVLCGRVGALDAIEAVVNILRTSKTVEIAKQRLMSEIKAVDVYGQAYAYLDNVQATDILSMPLSKLVGMEHTALIDSQRSMDKEITRLRKIITPNGRHQRYDALNHTLVKELQQTREMCNKHHRSAYGYDDVRRTEIVGELSGVTDEDLIVPKDMVVTLTSDGYIKATELTAYRTQGRGGRGKAAAKPKPGDCIINHLVANTHNHLYMFTSKGRLYAPKVYELPEGERGAKGKPVNNVVSLKDGETITAMMSVTKDQRNDPNMRVVFVSRKGYIKQVALAAFSNVRDGGLNALTLAEDDVLVGAELMAPGADIILASALGQAVRFNESTVRVSLRGSGMMRGMTLSDMDTLVGMQVCVDDKAQVLTVSSLGVGKITNLGNFRSMTNRGGKGVKATKHKVDDERMIAMLALTPETTDVTLISRNGVMVRIPVADIRTTDRTARGVKLVSLDEGDIVVSATLVDQQENHL